MVQVEKNKRYALCAGALTACILTACAGNNASMTAGTQEGKTAETTTEYTTEATTEKTAEATTEYTTKAATETVTEPTQPHTQIAGLEWQGYVDLSYAEGFTIEAYKDGYRLITISGDAQYLIVPENGEAPQDLKNDITVINQPVSDIYMAATGTMDMFRSLDALDTITLSGADADGWYIEEAKQAVESGAMLYAGKYSAPDYELILSKNCPLAIENTMILHTPEVKEQLEKLGVAVLVDYASNESHPLGRIEWVKLYGTLLGKEAQAQQIFDAQATTFAEIEEQVQKSDKTVVLFYLTDDGAASVRSPSDYMVKIIETAGGNYVFADLETDGKKTSSITMQMEAFYAGAKSADYLIYNSTIGNEYKTLSALLEQEPLLKDFEAVKENRVWCVPKSLYQESMSAAKLLTDIYAILNEETPQTTCLYHIE